MKKKFVLTNVQQAPIKTIEEDLEDASTTK